MEKNFNPKVVINNGCCFEIQLWPTDVSAPIQRSQDLMPESTYFCNERVNPSARQKGARALHGQVCPGARCARGCH